VDVPQDALTAFAVRLREWGWVSDLLVGGSLATGDYRRGASDLDLAAVVDGPVTPARLDLLVALHRELDDGVAHGLDLGCVYVDGTALAQVGAAHPTWTHGQLVRRHLSGIARAELLRHGYARFGRAPTALLAPMTADDVRAAARAELTGYWTWALRRPWVWFEPTLADLSLTTMARVRHTLRTGELVTKSAALGEIVPPWLAERSAARRAGNPVDGRRLRIAVLAWNDARRTLLAARSTTRPAPPA